METQTKQNKTTQYNTIQSQEARGSGISGQHYFVENIFEELDVPGEWFHDPVDEKLYYYPNATHTATATATATDADAIADANPNAVPFKEVVAPNVAAIFRLEGASDVAFTGLTFTETRATYLEQYEVPSGTYVQWSRV